MIGKRIPELLMHDGELCEVAQINAHPPGTHDDSPIRNELYAVECGLDTGARRWYGGTNAYIDSHLRMVIEGYEGAESGNWTRVS